MARLWIAALLVVLGCSGEDAPSSVGSGGGAGVAGSSPSGGAGGAGGGAGAGGSAGSAGASAGTGGEAALPSVAFVSPKDGSTVPNPVTFEIAAANVDEVEIFADETYSLGPSWDPADKSTLRYRFGGTGIPRPLHVTGRIAGKDVVRADITLTIQPDSCEDQFFLYHFAKNNVAPAGMDLFDPREDALAAIHTQVDQLKACGAGVTLGNMMALILFEGAFRVGAFNTLCEENSYNQTATGCDAVPEALYSYQFGLGAIHTSNFHPCKGGAWTQKMRSLLLAGVQKAGFPADPSIVTASDKTKLSQICPSATAGAVDHYILGAHDPFGIPKDGKGNHLQAYGKFPLFDPEISLALSLHPITAACASVADDRDAIAVWGGGDTSYSTTAKQDQIMASWKSFQANCK